MPGGSQEMIDDGCLSNCRQNLWYTSMGGYRTGTIYSRPVLLWHHQMNSQLQSKVKGGHGAKPHETIDPIVII